MSRTPFLPATRQLLAFGAALHLLVGCPGPVDDPDGGVEPSVETDAGEPDAQPDTEEPEGQPDGGEPDVPTDAGEPEVPVTDGGAAPDAGSGNDAGTADAGADVDAGAPDAGVEGAPRFAFITQVFGESTNSYVVLSDSLEGDTQLGTENAIEIPGRALGFGPQQAGVLFVTGDESPALTRYRLQRDGSLVEDGTVSFAAEGVTSIGEYSTQMIFLSDTKAYFVDGGTGKVILWNPTALTVTHSTTVAGLLVTDATTAMSQTRWHLINNKIYFPVGWRLGLAVHPQAGMLVIDTTDDSAALVTDSRGGYVRDAVHHTDDKLYVATETYGATVHRINNALAPAPVMLRFDPATDTYDDAFSVDLAALTGHAAAGMLTASPDGTVTLRFLDETAYTVEDDAHPRAVSGVPFWGTLQVTLGDEPVVSPRPDLPLSAGSVLTFDVGNATVVPQFAGDYAKSSLLVMESGIPAETSLDVTGLVFSMVRLR